LRAVKNAQKTQQIAEMGTIYTCQKNPQQFFCNGSRLLLLPEYQFLFKMIEEQIRRETFNVHAFQKGLFVMIGKF